tara:strand:- start:177 stop:1679 length:1503 start_codon:yes stop_codon:yes gene_type:complete
MNKLSVKISNSKNKIPNNVYYIFGFKKQTEEFLFCYYLSILSIYKYNNPDNIYFYYHFEPYGIWWDKVQKFVILKKVDIPTNWDKKKITNYAHASDKLRMNLLYKYGGIYVDIDTICVKSYHKLLDNDCVMGIQKEPLGLCNAIMMCKPKCQFFKNWLNEYENNFISANFGDKNNSWDNASVLLPFKLYLKNKKLITVLNTNYFFDANWDETSLIFEKDNCINDDLTILHLWESTSMKYLKQINNFNWFKNNSNTLYGKIGLKLIKKFNIGIPKIIHQTWKKKEIPDKMKFCVNSWKILNPDYKYMFWTDTAIESFVKKNYSKYFDIYSKLKKGIQKADLFRILVLHHYGGIYADIDFECLIPIDNWDIDHTTINIAYEPKEHHNKNILCNALIVAPKKIDELLDIVDYGKKKIINNPFEVMDLFGPFAWTNTINNFNLIKSNLFYPIPDITINQEIENKYKNIIKKRHFKNSWAVHYWEHSNWPRKSILCKYFNFLSPD